jgi:hypothetical protein
LPAYCQLIASQGPIAPDAAIGFVDTHGLAFTIGNAPLFEVLQLISAFVARGPMPRYA